MRKFVVLVGLLLISLVLFAQSEPFLWSVDTTNNSMLKVKVVVAKDCYLYKPYTTIKVANGLLVAPAQSVDYLDSISNENMEVYPSGTHIWSYKLSKIGDNVVEIDYQGCRAAQSATQPAVCFMPQQLTLNGASTALATAETYKLPFKVERVKEGLMSVDEFAAFLKNDPNIESATNTPWGDSRLWVILLLTLLGGIGLNLTPCILPMIPVNLAILGADGSNWRQGACRATFYGAGMAIAYGVLGAVVVLTGAKFGTLNASSWFNFGIGAVFILLSLAMFGVFNLDFSSFSANVNPSKLNWGKSLTALILGVLAALLAGACVAPVVIAVIVLSSEIYSSGNFAGLLLPFVLGLGMALPWPFAGAGLAIIPTPGMWMNKVKIVFGVIILLAAAYYGYLGWTLLPGEYNVEAQFANVDIQLAKAREEGKSLLIKFDASWCKNCAEMTQHVIPAPAVKQELQNYVMVTFNAEQISQPKVKAFLDALKINGLPAFAIVK